VRTRGRCTHDSWETDAREALGIQLLHSSPTPELGEYLAFIRNSPELATAYTDTLGDLVLGLSGATLTAAIAVIALGRPRSPAERGRSVR